MRTLISNVVACRADELPLPQIRTMAFTHILFVNQDAGCVPARACVASAPMAGVTELLGTLRCQTQIVDRGRHGLVADLARTFVPVWITIGTCSFGEEQHRGNLHRYGQANSRYFHDCRHGKEDRKNRIAGPCPRSEVYAVNANGTDLALV